MSEIVVEQRFLKENSASYYTSARDHFTGSDADKAEKAKYLLKPLFGEVLIGINQTQYNNPLRAYGAGCPE